MTHYEAVFILTPVLSDAQMKDTVEKFKKVLKDNKAEIVHEENWGLRKLAYEINHKTTGFYQLIEFKADPSVVDTLELAFKRDEKVMRFLTTYLNKYGVEFNEKRRQKAKQKKKEESSEPEKEEASS